MVQSLERAFAVLESFRGNEEMGVSQLVAATGLPKTTIHRIVRTLMDLGYVEQDPRTAQYRLSLRFTTLARTSLERLSWRLFALSVMQQLQAETDESIYLGVQDGPYVLYIDEVVSRQPVRVGSSIGLKAPLHATAAGKVILAHLPQHQQRTLLEEYTFVRFTPQTIRTPDALLAQLNEIRRRGYAVNDEEWVVDARYLAGAILDHNGFPVGAISLGAPLNRLPKVRWGRVAAKVGEACRRVSSSLGYAAT